MKNGAGIFRKLIGLLLVFVSTLCAATETITFYHTDVLGSPVAATDSYGTVVWKATYQPFGDETKLGDVSSLDATGYAGHRLEADLNLVYMNARYYDPIVGRFYSIDPVGFDESNDMSFNRYAYANNNPYAYVDLNGESPSPLDAYDFVHDVGNLLVQEAVYFAAVVNGNQEVAQYAIEGMVEARLDAATSTAGLVSPVPGTGRAMKMASKVAKNAEKLCFVEGTPVHTQDGLKPIEEIEVGDLVASKDELTGETTWKPVVELFRNKNKSVLNITLVNGDAKTEVLGATPEHPFWVDGKEWVQAGELQEGDHVVSLSGDSLVIDSIVPDADQHTTYNFEVADFHTYFVGKEGAWVHNTCKQIFNSIKDSPNYPQGFKALSNGTTKNTVDNKELLNLLRQQEPGKWQKVYKDGFDGSGNKVSIHYFSSESGKVFDVKTKNYWSNN